jgi:ribosome-associated heat shock protein Hsp15
MEEVRLDQWLWAVRLYRSRSLATAACRGGHVRVNGRPAKPATTVRAGDRIEAHVAERDRVLEVVSTITKRVSASLAAECLVDHSPPAPPRETVPPPLFQRPRGTGRPTKKERRALLRFRDR